MRKTMFIKQVDVVDAGLTCPDPFSCAECGGRPFADPINGEDCCFIEWAGKEGAGGMTHVVIAEAISPGRFRQRAAIHAAVVSLLTRTKDRLDENLTASDETYHGPATGPVVGAPSP